MILPYPNRINMANSSKSRKKKKPQQSRKVPTAHEKITSSYIQYYKTAIRKHLQFLGVDLDLFDRLSKKTKLYLMNNKATYPTFVIKKGSIVPMVYIRFLNKYIIKYLQANEYGRCIVEDVCIGYTYEDYFLVGRMFDLMAIHSCQKNFFPPDQLEILRPVVEATRRPEIVKIHDRMQDYMAISLANLLNCYSQINYRYYCIEEEFVINDRLLGECYYVYSQESERKKFTIDNIDRTAMRVGHVIPRAPTKWVSFERGKIINSNSKELLPVYMQGHVIHRMKERINISAFYRNLTFPYTFFREENTKLEENINGWKLIPVYDHAKLKLGYFHFIIVDNCVLIKSFLPLTSPNTKEGSALHKILNVKKEDLIFFGLDKLSFYLETDFEKLPTLKKALEEAGIWHLTEIQPTDSEYEILTERKTDKVLEKFFEYRADDDEDLLST